jgi:hypothetical protein
MGRVSLDKAEAGVRQLTANELAALLAANDDESSGSLVAGVAMYAVWFAVVAYGLRSVAGSLFGLDLGGVETLFVTWLVLRVTGR